MKILLILLVGISANANLLFAQSNSQPTASIRPIGRITTDTGQSLQEVEGVDVNTTLSTITARQYCNFLNAVASVNDCHHLYDSKNHSDLISCKLQFSFSKLLANHYHYSVVHGKEEEPITNISLLDGMRYCNWLENGKAKASQETQTTEDGVYTLKGNEVIAVNANGTHLLVNSTGLLGENFIPLSSLSELPSHEYLARKSPDRELCIVSTTAPE